VLTLGRNANRSNVLASDEMLAARGVALHEINRGGDVTYHGPGQLVGYPIFDLRSLRNPSSGARLGPVDFVRLMEEALIRVCGIYGIPAGRICGLTGVWVAGDASPLQCSNNLPSAGPAGEAKIGAIGIHVSRGISSHGFAFNVTTDLRDFSLINPCGITDRPVTSLENEIRARAVSQQTESRNPEVPSLEALAHQAARQFGIVFDQQVIALESLAALRTQADAAATRLPDDPAQPFPAQDTPLQVPPEVDRLLGAKDRPVRA
jgi:lipoyl(octanoyl) transferase